VKKIYGISPQQYNTLSPYIKIADQKPKGSANKYLKHQVTQPKEEKKENQKVKIDINTAGPETLQKLYGIGPVFAERIIKYRKILGGFHNTQQLLEVYDFSTETYNNIQNMIYADTSKITRLNLNKADYKTLLRHPYLNNYQVKGIIRYRKFKKNIRRLDEIIENNILPGDVYIKIKHYLTVEH
jgi:competence ComEA-like helix-hairpin-helix protein